MATTRAEAANLNDTMLQLRIDGCVHRLRSDWADGRPGSLTDLYDLAVLRAEAVLRDADVDGPRHQFTLFTSDGTAA